MTTHTEPGSESFDQNYLTDVLWEIESYVHVPALTPAALRLIKHEAIECWRAGYSTRRAADLTAIKLGARDQ